LLQKATEASRNHEFWADDLPLSALGDPLKQRLRGHKQVTDAYLLALAIHRKGKLVTFDTRVRTLAPEGSAEADALVILRL
jgi:predicted nucleic acid-binding protein